MKIEIMERSHKIALLGDPVAHSVSPAMHNAAARALGVDLTYHAIQVEPAHLPNTLNQLIADGFTGFNVTVPHKQTIMPLLHHIDDAALAIGAVNTLMVQPDGTLWGTNTDGAGFMADLEGLGIEGLGRDCLILGAGGSARAVTYALAQAGAHLHIAARRIEQAQDLVDMANRLSPHHSHQAHPFDSRAALSLLNPLIINTTPLGMSPNVESSPWPDGAPLPSGTVVYDLVYNPDPTRLVREACAAGHRAFTGLGMLVGQGAQAFTLWTGHAAPRNIMHAAATRALSSL